MSLPALSKREQAVLPYMLQGLLSAEIAPLLPGATLTTVRNASSRILHKLGLYRMEAILADLEADEDWETDPQKRTEYRRAAQLLSHCSHRERRVLRIYLAQWLGFYVSRLIARQQGTKKLPDNQPTVRSVADEMGNYHETGVQKLINSAARRVGQSHTNWYALLRMEYQAEIYANLTGQYVPRPSFIRSDRQWAVYRQMLRGYPNHIIAKRLHMTQGAVKAATRKICEQAGLGRISLVVTGVELPRNQQALGEFKLAARKVSALPGPMRSELWRALRRHREYHELQQPTRTLQAAASELGCPNYLPALLRLAQMARLYDARYGGGVADDAE